MRMKYYSDSEIKHHLTWMRDNTKINPFAIMDIYDRWQHGILKNYEVTRWIDYVLEENEIVPEWK